MAGRVSSRQDPTEPRDPHNLWVIRVRTLKTQSELCPVAPGGARSSGRSRDLGFPAAGTTNSQSCHCQGLAWRAGFAQLAVEVPVSWVWSRGPGHSLFHLAWQLSGCCPSLCRGLPICLGQHSPWQNNSRPCSMGLQAVSLGRGSRAVRRRADAGTTFLSKVTVSPPTWFLRPQQNVTCL